MIPSFSILSKESNDSASMITPGQFSKHTVIFSLSRATCFLHTAVTGQWWQWGPLPQIRDKDGTNYLHSLDSLYKPRLRHKEYTGYWAVFQWGTGFVALWVILCLHPVFFQQNCWHCCMLATSHQCTHSVCLRVDLWMLECKTQNCSHLSIVCNKDSRLWCLHFGTSRKKTMQTKMTGYTV